MYTNNIKIDDYFQIEIPKELRQKGTQKDFDDFMRFPNSDIYKCDNHENEPDLSKCPNCGGIADNGHSRDDPPDPYYCTKCEEK